jgi:DNA-binding beta-propeller fold protein YncE
MVVNAVANKVYINALALDGTTGAVLDTLNGLGSVMCLNPRTQKLYCVDDNPVYMYVFDCTADTLVARIRPLHVESVFSIACDTLTNRVYAAASASSTPRDVILVIDGDADTIAARIAGPAQGRLLASTKRGRVYAADLGGPELAVFDTGTDRLLRTILIGGESRLMCYDSIDAKVYYVTPSLLGEASAIDAATNQPVGHVQVGQYARSVIWHTPTNRVYVGGRQDITVIDPTTDIVAKVLAVRGYLLCSAPRQNKVYAISGPFELSVIDCRNDSVTKTIVIPTYGALSMCYVAYDKLYIGGEGTGALSIIDCVGDTLIRSYPFGYTVLAAGREGQQVYCAQTFSLCTFDAAGDTLVAEVPWVASGGGDLLYVPSADKIYYACLAGGQDCILVADGRTDSVIAEIPLHLPASLGNESTNGLVYCGQELYDSAVTFINNRTDSVVGSQITGLTATTFVTVPAHNRVYVGGYGKSFIPVIRTDLPGVEEAAQPRTKNEVRPAIVSRNSPLIAHQPSILLDAAGRKVLELLPGPNHVRGLAPGVYFVRQQGSRGQGFEDSRVTKVVMTR